VGLGARLFLDGGHTYSSAGKAMETLAGWGYGLDYRYRDVDFYVHRAQALIGSSQFTRPEDWVTYLGISYRHVW
jgi:hemolysin activation/secretion protein